MDLRATMEEQMNSRLARSRILGNCSGYDDDGFVDVPVRFSNVKISRFFAEPHGECGFCFPHGIETSNATRGKNFRSWKHYRGTQYRPKE